MYEVGELVYFHGSIGLGIIISKLGNHWYKVMRLDGRGRRKIICCSKEFISGLEEK